MNQLYVDMHSHILPRLDDGSKSMEMTIHMFEIAHAEGIRFITATSHANIHNRSVDFVRRYYDVFMKTRTVLKEYFPDMELFPGNEIMYYPGVARALKERQVLSLNGSRYVLVEFMPDETYKHLLGAVRELSEAGYTPVFAHIERIDCLWKRIDRLDELKERYVVFQMNTHSLLGSTLNVQTRQCRSLVKAGYIDILGSDAHNLTDRAPCFSEPLNWIAENCGEEMMTKLTVDNPKMILRNQLLR